MEDGEDNSGHVAEIDKWADSLAKMLEDVPQYMCVPGHPGRVARIPENLREVDVKAYEPKILSIGPYHHGNPRVEQMEKRKSVVLRCFLEQNPDLTLKDLLMEIESIEPESRSFYSDVKMESENFVQMLLLDSVFILLLFCGMPRSQENPNYTNTRNGSLVENENTSEMVNHINEGVTNHYDSENRQMLITEDESRDELSIENNKNSVRWFLTMFVHDLLLLENQLPFFVLQKIYDLAYGSLATQLITILKLEVGNMLSNYTKLNSETVIPPSEEVHHLLHLCHMFFLPNLQDESNVCELHESSEMYRLGSAIQLSEAGVSFEATSDSSKHSLLDITFGSIGKMTMPCLHVDDNIGSLLRNLIALEQMKYPRIGLNVSAYVVLLLHLVTTPEDVKLLRRKGIIEHHLASDKEMMSLINRLSVGLSFDYVEDQYSLKPIFQELNRYTKRRLPRWRAWLRQRYFNNPWAIVSLLAASLFLMMSAFRTCYTVYSYYHPR